MIAYFAPIPVLLYPVLCHKMVLNKGKKAVLFIDEGVYKSRKLYFVTEELKKNDMFKEVVACKMLIVWSSDTSINKAEDKIVETYDKIFKESGYDVYSFDEIYTMNDGWGGEQNVYFNIRKIPYTWIQIGYNYIPKPNSDINFPHADLMNKYQALTPFAEYSDACLFDSSDLTMKQLDEKNKNYTLWNRDQCFSKITEDEMDKLFSVFHLVANCFAYVDADTSALIIKNSFGYVSDFTYVRPPLLFGDYSKAEIFSIMDKVSIDFYAPQAKEIYIKYHIHDPLDATVTKRLYGDNAVSLPNIPFEILGRYINERNIRFDKIIGTVSTSLSAISSENYNQFYPLGLDFARTWWFYLSIYVSLIFAKEQEFKHIFCNDILLTQIALLSKEIEYGVEVSILNTKEISKVKNSLIIIDLRMSGNTDFSKVDKTSTVILLNSELYNDVFTGSSEMFAPICIKKEKISDVECDILFRDETLWVYSSDKEIKKAARNFVFEKRLNNLGMRIYSEKITFPEAIRLFHSKQSLKENEKLKAVIERQGKQIQVLTEYVSNPGIIEKRLKSTDDIYIYLDILQMIRSKYLIALAIRDTPGNFLPQDIMDRLFDLGFTKFSKELWRMYIGVSIKSAVVFNQTGERQESPVEYMFNSNNISLNVTSKAWRQGNKADIIINGVDYAVNMRGLNIVVYDAERNCLVDSIGFDAHEENWHFKRK